MLQMSLRFHSHRNLCIKRRDVALHLSDGFPKLGRACTCQTAGSLATKAGRLTQRGRGVRGAQVAEYENIVGSPVYLERALAGYSDLGQLARCGGAPLDVRNSEGDRGDEARPTRWSSL